MSGGSTAPGDPAEDPRATYRYAADEGSPTAALSGLDELVEGEVRFDAYTRQLYATDASAYEVTPIGVVFPTSTDDVAAVMGYCAERGVPVLPRGGGTSLAGQAVNEAVVLDFTRHMDRVLDVDPDARRARVEAGATLAVLNERAGEHGLKFAPDPSTADRSAIGGAIGNNSTGAHSLVYGKTDVYVESCEVVLADGTVTTFGEVGLEELRERADPTGSIPDRVAATVTRFLDEEADAIRAAYPTLKRNVSGYNLDLLVEEADDGAVNLARLLAGSEGTLAIVTEATVSLEPVPETKSVAVLTYHDLLETMHDVGPILEHGPAAVEVLDEVLLDLARELAEFEDVVDRLPPGTRTFLLIEFYADSDAARRQAVERLLEDRVGEFAFDAVTAFEPADREALWHLRKASTPILMSRTTDEKHHAFIEDIAIPSEHLAEYVEAFRGIMADHDTIGSFYAHAGPGCMHVRPLVNTKTAAGIEHMASIADAATDLAVRLGGAVSGEHGDGRARTQWNRKLYGEHVWELFGELKDAFDPDWLLNPGSVCGEHRMTEHLRYDPDYDFEAGFEPELAWDVDNGFQGMVELCHGCGGCRGDQSTTGGVMCPTYRASREEITSTRGRANLLRQAMSGDLGEEAPLDLPFMREVLDLCVGCKGCARDCPSEVDMAKLKVEVAHAHHERHGADLRSRLFADVDRVARLGSATAPLANRLAANGPFRRILERTLGIARERTLPRFQRRSFVAWFEARGGSAVAAADAERSAVLVADPYTNYANPDIGRAAVRVLEAAGVHVAVPDDVTDTGRPAYSSGLLDQARARADTLVDRLAPAVADGAAVVFLEPSDAVMVQDDYASLLGGPDVDAVRAEAYGLMEYLDRADLVNTLVDRLDPQSTPGTLTYHGHCHQKATGRDGHAVAVLERLGFSVDALDSTCCGMAGSFGYEAEHFSMSRAIGRLLLEQVRESDAETVVAPGTSCRTQLGEDLEPGPSHPIEVVADHLV